MPAPSRHLKETFECIAYIGGLYKDQKQTKKGKKSKNARSGPLWEAIHPNFDIFELIIGFPMYKNIT